MMAACILVWMVVCTVAGQAGDCLDYVREVYQSMNFPQQQSQAKTCYYLKYSLRTIMRDTTVQKNSYTTAEVFVQGNIMRVIGKEMQIYQDANNIVAITPATRSILLRSAVPVENPQKAVERMLFFQDTIFASSEVVHCTDKIEKGRQIREIQMEIKKQARHLFPFYRILVVVDTKSKVLRRMKLEYQAAQAIKTVEIDYHTLDYQHRIPSDFDRSALSFVMASTREVKPEFRQYKIVDIRRQTVR